ncbi:copper ion binding protein [Paenibacillus dendritiformis]|uniref:Copper ion binding protein n=1 Tax=Paenibacillus dendritiformis C454 TaxID=1131935 RepID=H3SE67_9BACL|nr:copper ion binding protein [Paenibacillus dendritiformis]EHQ62578.1 copper ion binding protein [Paenibacillus dendritiformis C454]PZM63013.1 copper chaperone [Paenibacillus dendritiformis]CAH8770101.1 copper ion binding protein [Paenibacillus dendritiformis]
MTEVTWKVEGMTCGHCKQAVEKAVQEAGGEAKVDLGSKQVKITYDNAKVQPEKIREAIEDQGYDVVS